MQSLGSMALRLRQMPLRGCWNTFVSDRTLAGATIAALVCGMGCLGLFVAAHIKDNLVHKAAAATALYMDSFVAPLAQELATRTTLSATTQAEMSKLLSPAAAGRPLVGVRIWVGQTIVFSNDKMAIGKSFPSTPESELAWSGHVTGEFNQIDEDDEQIFDVPLPILEVYAPVRERGTGRIIALIETYEAAAELETRILTAQAFAWLLIGASTLGIGLLLLGVMRSARRKQNSLASQIGELLRMKADVEGEQRRLRRAARGANENNEHNLRRIGTELYSGPVQLISLALLKIEAVCASAFTGGHQVPPTHVEDIEIIRQALGKTLDEMRNVSSELILFEIENLSLADSVCMAARRHARKTGRPVRCDAGGVATADVHGQLKTCLYRFAQEGLDRASHYATGGEHVVRASRDGEAIGIEVITGQPNQSGQQEAFLRSVTSLRDRVESWGGTFEVKTDPASGASIIARFAFTELGAAHG
jgi:signal transduction histidine kinase